LIMPVLLILMIGLVDVGLVTYETMQVQNSADAAAIYASQHSEDLAGITAAVVNATGTTGITASPGPTSFCGCPGAAGIDIGPCATLCASGKAQGRYVQVSASFTHVPILTFTGIPNPLVLTKQSTIRVQ
jgi:Flp pilus assembly protein TadG